jgi:hypothetical protein
MTLRAASEHASKLVVFADEAEGQLEGGRGRGRGAQAFQVRDELASNEERQPAGWQDSHHDALFYVGYRDIREEILMHGITPRAQDEKDPELHQAT